MLGPSIPESLEWGTDTHICIDIHVHVCTHTFTYTYTHTISFLQTWIFQWSIFCSLSRLNRLSCYRLLSYQEGQCVAITKQLRLYSEESFTPCYLPWLLTKLKLKLDCLVSLGDYYDDLEQCGALLKSHLLTRRKSPRRYQQCVPRGNVGGPLWLPSSQNGPQTGEIWHSIHRNPQSRQWRERRKERTLLVRGEDPSGRRADRVLLLARCWPWAVC